MNTCLNTLLLVLILLSYYQLPSSISVEARNLNSHDFFTIDLIHRDSLLSPHHNYSKTALGSVSHGHQIRLSSAYYDSKNPQADVIPTNGGDYVMKVAIGTPPVEFIATVDTGSDLIWLQCAPCQKCLHQKSPLFNPTKSSTYTIVSCNSQICNLPDVSGNCGSNNQCVYNANYEGNISSNGIIGTDTLSFGSSSTLPSTIFGCGYDQQGELDPSEGIIGLGAGPASLVSQLGETINYKFSYCLVPSTSGATSKIKFGLGVTGPNVVSTPLTIQTTDYYLTLDGISIGDSWVQVGYNIIIDSGTTLTYLDTSTYKGLRAGLTNAITLSPTSDPDVCFDLCYEAKESFNPPDVVFHFRGADVVLKAENTFMKLERVTCLAIVPTNGTFKFGNMAQVNYAIGYDLLAKTISFAPTDCTNY